MELGKLIKEKRKREKLSVAKLSILLGISPDNIYKWEKGVKPSNMEDYQKITTWLNLENVPEIQPVETNKLLNVMVELMSRQNEILERQTKNLEEKIDKVDSNLGTTSTQLDALAVLLKARCDDMLSSLARIEGLNPQSSVEEAGSKARAELQAASKHGK